MHAIARFAKLVPLAAALVSSLPALADGPPEDGATWGWGLGLGVASSRNAYKGFERDNGLYPLLQYENRYVKVFGPGLDVKLPSWQINESQKVNFSLVGQYDLGSGYEAKDSYVFEGMTERKSSFWVGGKLEWENDLVNVSAELLGDASGESKGTRFSLGLSRTWHIGQHWMLTPRAVAKWHDSKYTDYYYGVRDSEARTGRAAYRGDSGVNAEVGLSVMYLIDRQQSLFLDVGVNSLSSSIKHSPLVDRSTENNVFFGYLYRFR
jgi:outer membrane protein